jgi:hypothetical protein
MDPSLRFAGDTLAATCAALAPTGCCFRAAAQLAAATAQQLCLPTLAAEYSALPGRCALLAGAAGEAGGARFRVCACACWWGLAAAIHGGCGAPPPLLPPWLLCTFRSWSRARRAMPAVPESCVAAGWANATGLGGLLRPRGACPGTWGGPGGGLATWLGTSCGAEVPPSANGATNGATNGAEAGEACPTDTCGLLCGLRARFVADAGGG